MGPKTQKHENHLSNVLSWNQEEIFSVYAYKWVSFYSVLHIENAARQVKPEPILELYEHQSWIEACSVRHTWHVCVDTLSDMCEFSSVTSGSLIDNWWNLFALCVSGTCSAMMKVRVTACALAHLLFLALTSLHKLLGRSCTPPQKGFRVLSLGNSFKVISGKTGCCWSHEQVAALDLCLISVLYLFFFWCKLSLQLPLSILLFAGFVLFSPPVLLLSRNLVSPRQLYKNYKAPPYFDWQLCSLVSIYLN